MRFSRSMLLFLMMAAVAMMAGCEGEGDTTTSASGITNPNPGVLQPTGTIQGVLVDKVTLEPLSGAVISIGLSSDTTASNGQFVLRDVPCTDDMAANSLSVDENYIVTIDLRTVNSRITSGPTYADFAYSAADVLYTSLPNTNPAIVNGATPVTGLVADLPLKVGKLSATIQGTVAYDATAAEADDQVWNVMLVSASPDICLAPGCFDSPNSATGNAGNIIATEVTTVTDATFTFSNVEAITDFVVVAMNGTQTFYGTENVESPADGQTKILVIQHDDDGPDNIADNADDLDNSTVFVGRVDDLDPVIVSVTPEDGSNLGAATSVDVVYTFSEPINQDALTDPTSVDSDAIDELTSVDFDGQVYVLYKGNMDGMYSVAWNATFDQLTVSIPSLKPASVYTVDLASVLDPDANPATDDGILADVNDNLLADPSGLASVTFYTTATACAPAAVTVAALSQPYDWSATADLDWYPAVCAKEYNVYKRCDEVWGATTLVGQETLLASISATATTNGVVFIDTADECSNIKLECTYTVASVGADNAEGSSASVTVSDTEEPDIAGASDSFNAGVDTDYTDDTLTLAFSEPLDELSAEDETNYTLNDAAFLSGTAPGVLIATYGCTDNGGPYEVALTFDAAVNEDDFVGYTVNAGNNGICDILAGTGEDEVIPQNQGLPNSVCVSNGNVSDLSPGTELNSSAGALAPDDYFMPPGCDDGSGGGIPNNSIIDNFGTESCTSVVTGANGICQTDRVQEGAVWENDQDIPIDEGLDNALCIRAGLVVDTGALEPQKDYDPAALPDGVDCDGAGGADDFCEWTQNTVLTITGGAAGLTDVSGNGMDADADQIDNDDTIH